jgi:hypothetical protein
MAHEPTHRVAIEKKVPSERLLALEIRSWKFGYALVEGTSVLDWGVAWFPTGESSVAIRRLAFLLKIHAPYTVIARRTRRANHESSKSAAQVLRRIGDDLKHRSMRFVVLARRDVRKFFVEQGCRNKHDIAAAVANRFSQLKPRIPRFRRAWDPESGITAVFDAVATAVAFEALQESISNG